MADEIDPNDLGTEDLLEGSADIMSGIDEVMETNPNPDQSGAGADKGGKDGEGDGVGKGAATEKTDDEKAEEQRLEAERQKAEEAAKGGDKKYPEEIKSVKARHHFDVLKGEKEAAETRAKTLDAKVREFETQLKELQGKAGAAAPEVKILQKENEELKSRLDEREKVLAYKAVEETDAFRDGVTKPKEAALADLNEAADAIKIDGAKIDQILGEPNKFKRAQMLGELTREVPEEMAFVKNDLREAIEKFVAADKKEHELRQNAKGLGDYAEHEKSQKSAKETLQRVEAFKTERKGIEEKLRQNAPEVMEEGIWKEVAEKVDSIPDLDKLHPRAKVYNAIAGFALKRVLRVHREVKAELEKTKGILAARTASQPGAGGGRSDGGGKRGSEDDEAGFDEEGGLMGRIDEVLTQNG